MALGLNNTQTVLAALCCALPEAIVFFFPIGLHAPTSRHPPQWLRPFMPSVFAYLVHHYLSKQGRATSMEDR